MYEKINYLLVGLFVIFFTALASYFAFWLSKSDMSSKNFNKYRVVFNESVDGLSKDSTVKLNGVDAGRVKKIALDKEKPYMVVVDILIDNKLEIRKDMYAQLEGQGLTGLRYINIIGGKSTEQIVPNKESSIIASKPSFLSKLSARAPELIDKVSQIFTDKNINNVDKILANSSLATDEIIELEEQLKGLIGESNSSRKFSVKDFILSLKDINATVVEYKKLAKGGEKTITLVNKKLPQLLKNINLASKKLQNASDLLSRSINRGDYNLKRILTPAVNELRSLSSDYRELGDEFKTILRDPAGSIFNGKSIMKGPGE